MPQHPKKLVARAAENHAIQFGAKQCIVFPKPPTYDPKYTVIHMLVYANLEPAKLPF